MRARVLFTLALIVVVAGCLPRTAAAEGPGTGESRLILVSTARSLPRGDGYVGVNNLLFLVSGQVGVTNRISIGVGAPLLSLGGYVSLAPLVNVTWNF